MPVAANASPLQVTKAREPAPTHDGSGRWAPNLASSQLVSIPLDFWKYPNIETEPTYRLPLCC